QRAGDGTDLISANFFAHGIDAVNHHLQRVSPRRFAPLAIFATHFGVRKAVVGVQAVVRETIAVRNPALVDLVVVKGHHTHDAVVFGLNNHIGTQAVVRADALATRQLPGTCAHFVGLGQQRTHRAQVDHVARQFGLDGFAHKGGDFRVLAALDHAHFHDATDFLAKADTAGAMDAALHAVGRNKRTHVLGRHHALGFLVTRTGCAVAHGQVLQLAFATLVAHGAIKRVVNPQEFHDALMGGHGVLG